MQINKSIYPDFLTEKTWEYNTMTCTEVLSFGDDGSFSYYETCGNPVADSDLYDTYSYDEKTSIITVYGYEEGMEEIKIEVLRYTEDSLLVRMEDKIKEFYVDSEVPNLSGEEEYDDLVGYSAYVAIIDVEQNTIKTAPYGYDPDAGGKETLREERLAEDVVFFDLFIKTVYTEEDSVTTISYEELSHMDATNDEDNSFGIGYIWYNDDLEIEKVIYYGALEVWE